MRSRFVTGLVTALGLVSRQVIQGILGILLGLSLAWLVTYWTVGALTYWRMAGV